MKYLVVIEEGPTRFGADVPDLPGCVAAGESREEASNFIHEAIKFHLDGLQHDGSTAPLPHSSAERVYVAA